MKIICNGGYYKFYPAGQNELFLFEDKYRSSLQRVGDYFTFPALAALPDYSIQGQEFGGNTAIINYADAPDIVFIQNKLNYDTIKHTIVTRTPGQEFDVSPAQQNLLYVGIPPCFQQYQGKTVQGYTGWLNVLAGYTIINEIEFENI